jgi:hypothetical protein
VRVSYFPARAIVFLHRWLGIAGCLLFIAWFASGIVMIYARMPELTAAERRAHLAPLASAPAARITPADAAARHGLTPDRVTEVVLLGRPVYRFQAGNRWTVVYADNGERFAGFTRDQAVRAAADIVGAHPAESAPLATPRPVPRYEERMVEPDQWTLQSRAQLPVHRVRLDDAGDTVLYLSDVSGEVTVKTTARERRIAYAGAVLHWLYFTPFRRHGPLWTQSIIWLSLAGSVMCVLGLVWGLYVGWRSPHRGWMRWHHYSGLIFGVVSFTWVFSGLLSMDPWNWHPGTAPTRTEREAFTGGPLRVDRLAAAPAPGVREREWTPFRGEPILADDDEVGPASAGAVSREALFDSAHAAMPGVAIEEAAVLDAYDAYYYSRAGELPLPVMRFRYADPARTWLYVDARRGMVLRREERLTRVNRWLYHGLHSLDFPWLYARRPLWDVVMIVLSLGGLASAVTAATPGWRRLRRHAQRLL